MALLRLRSVCTFVLLLAWLSPGSFAVKANEPRAAFSVELSNPVTPDEPPKRYKVFATTDPDGTPTGYNVRLQVHVCMDNQCRIVHLTMYWDALGYYQRIECPMNAPLTRMEHEVFTDADYRKLDRILKNRQSLLATLPYEALVVKQSEPAEGIDGWSAPRPRPWPTPSSRAPPSPPGSCGITPMARSYHACERQRASGQPPRMSAACCNRKIHARPTSHFGTSLPNRLLITSTSTMLLTYWATRGRSSTFLWHLITYAARNRPAEAAQAAR